MNGNRYTMLGLAIFLIASSFISACMPAPEPTPTAGPLSLTAAAESTKVVETQSALLAGIYDAGTATAIMQQALGLPTNTPQTMAPTNTGTMPAPTFTSTPLPTATPAGYKLTGDNVCIAFGGNEGIDGNVEIFWVEDITSFSAGLHYQHIWKEISNITQINSIVLDPYWEGINDTLQGKFCKVDGVWKGWMILRDGDFAFWDGISFTRRTSISTMDVYQHDENGQGSGKYAAYGNLWTVAEMRTLPGASQIAFHLDIVEKWIAAIDSGSVYLPFQYSEWVAKQWVLEAVQKK